MYSKPPVTYCDWRFTFCFMRLQTVLPGHHPCGLLDRLSGIERAQEITDGVIFLFLDQLPKVFPAYRPVGTTKAIASSNVDGALTLCAAGFITGGGTGAVFGFSASASAGAGGTSSAIEMSRALPVYPVRAAARFRPLPQFPLLSASSARAAA